MDKSLSKNYTFNVDDYNELLNEILENNVQSVINRCQKELYQIFFLSTLYYLLFLQFL